MKELGIIELRNKIKSGEISSEQITREYISAIKESKTNAVVEVFEDAIDFAKEMDNKIAAGFKPPASTFAASCFAAAPGSIITTSLVSSLIAK